MIILKQFSFFNKSNAALIVSMFDKFQICKPTTSRAINNENYLIGIGFLGLNIDINKLLKIIIYEKSIIEVIPDDILTNHQSMIEKFIITNKQYIEKNKKLANEFIK